MVDGVKVMRFVFKENMTAFAVGVVGEGVEEDDGAKLLFIFGREVEIVIFDIVFDVVLQRAGSVGTVIAIDSERDNVKAERLTQDVGGDFAQGEGVVGEVPERLFTFARFVDGFDRFAFVVYIHKEGVVAAEHELTTEVVLAIGERCADFWRGGDAHGKGEGCKLMVESKSVTCTLQPET